MPVSNNQRPRKKKPLPFSFVFDYLYPKGYTVKPMFGCQAIYIDNKIVMFLRQRASHPEINGVWIATERQHHESLKKLFPSMCSITVLGADPTNWQMIPETAEDFESSVILLCKLVKQGDKRIGKTPKKRGTKVRSAGKKHTTGEFVHK